MDHTSPQELYENQLKAFGYPSCSISHIRHSLLYKAAIEAIKMAIIQPTPSNQQQATSNQ